MKNLREEFESRVAKPPMGCAWSEQDKKYIAVTFLGLNRIGQYNRDYRVFCEGFEVGQSGDAIAWRVTDPETNSRFVVELRDPEQYQKDYPNFILEKCVLANQGGDYE